MQPRGYDDPLWLMYILCFFWSIFICYRSTGIGWDRHSSWYGLFWIYAGSHVDKTGIFLLIAAQCLFRVKVFSALHSNSEQAEEARGVGRGHSQNHMTYGPNEANECLRRNLWKLEHQCMEQPHSEKPVFTKETEDSCNFIQRKGESHGAYPHGISREVLGVQPPFILNSWMHVALFFSLVAEALERYSFFPATYQMFPLEHVSPISSKKLKVQVVWVLQWTCVDPFLLLP